MVGIVLAHTSQQYRGYDRGAVETCMPFHSVDEVDVRDVYPCARVSHRLCIVLTLLAPFKVASALGHPIRGMCLALIARIIAHECNAARVHDILLPLTLVHTSCLGCVDVCLVTLLLFQNRKPPLCPASSFYADGWAARVHDDINLTVLAIMAVVAAWSMWK